MLCNNCKVMIKLGDGKLVIIYHVQNTQIAILYGLDRRWFDIWHGERYL